MPSKWCLADLKAYFEEQGWDFAGTYGRIQDLVVKTMIAFFQQNLLDFSLSSLGLKASLRK